MFIDVNDGLCVDVRKTACPVVCWMVPPLPPVPVPVTVNPPLAPVELRTIPFAGPLAAVPAEVLSAALYTRFRSRQDDSYAAKVNAALRQQFGGHAVKEA